MTWGVQIAKADGTPVNCLTECKHGKQDANYRTPCYIVRAASTIGYTLTSIDVGADGHMACGTAVLKCNGFEAAE